MTMRGSDLSPGLRRYWHSVAFLEEVGEKPLAVCRLGGSPTQGGPRLGPFEQQPLSPNLAVIPAEAGIQLSC